MSTADKLLEKLFSWIEQRELCAEKLNKAALDLESHRKNLNISECVGSTTAVAGAACMIGVGVATVLTGGAAAPLLGMAATVCSGAGVCLSVGTKITEHFLSSHTMKEVEEIEKKSKQIAQDIQKLLEQLREEKQRAIPSANPDDLEQHIAAEILNAMARKILPQFQSITSTCDQKKQPEIHFDGKSAGMAFTHKSVLFVSMIFFLFAFLAAEVLNFKIDLLLLKGLQGLFKKLSKTGLKTVAIGGAMVAGAAVMVFELHEAKDTWKKLIDSNHVTEDSKSIRKSAEELQKHNQQFNDIRRGVENDLLVNLALKMCRDEAVKQWMTEKLNSGDFHKLADVFHFLKKRIDEEEKKDHGYHVDIIFVAHGAIRDSMITAKCLLPLSTVEDVVLYSPWNCLILADAVYAVAAGIMKPQDRVFKCSKTVKCKIPDEEHRPKKLPNRWNSMKEAGDKLVPNITLSPLKPPKDGALNTLESLIKNHGLPERNRIFIPYILPAGKESSESVPFYVVSLALSLVLLGRKFKATLHLTTCLGDQSAGKKLDKKYLRNQYAYTIDHTVMTANTDIFREMTRFTPAAGDISKYCLCSSQ